jgi:surface polysaccharide O-acyltransferase-like enzyme
MIGDIASMLTRFAVPVFLMISGALLLNREYDLSGFVKKRYPRILIPFIFWAVMYIVFAIIFQGKVSILDSASSTIIYSAKTFLGLPGYTRPFWYIWLILGVYLFVPIINRWIQKTNLREIEYFLIIWIITSICGTFAIPLFDFYLSYFTGPIGFLIAGYYLSVKKNKILENSWIWGILFILATAIRVIFSYKLTLLTGKLVGFDIYNLITVVQAISLFLAIKNFNTSEIFSKISSFFKRGLAGVLTISLSKYSFGIYLIHILTLRVIYEFGFTYSGKNALIWIPTLTVLVLILSWAFLVILERVPALKKITGVH